MLKFDLGLGRGSDEMLTFADIRFFVFKLIRGFFEKVLTFSDMEERGSETKLTFADNAGG